MNEVVMLSSRAAVLSTTPFLISGLIFASGCNSNNAGSTPSASTNTSTGTAAISPVTNAPYPTTPIASMPTGTGTGVATGTGTGTGTAPQVGETCTGDPNKSCLAMHFVAYTDSTGTPTATTDQAATIIHTMNQLWAQCSIGFQIEKYETADPTKMNLSYGAQSQNELNQIRTAFDTSSTELLGVTTGPWGTTVNAWTNMPGDGIYGAIMEASIVTYGNGIIYAHEFGHYLGLDHVSDESDLMNPVIYTTSTTLTSSQCQTAKNTINSYWTAMIRM